MTLLRWIPLFLIVFQVTAFAQQLAPSQELPQTMLVLTSHFGGGHDAVAQSVVDTILSIDPNVRVLAQNVDIEDGVDAKGNKKFRRLTDQEVFAALNDGSHRKTVVVKDYADFALFNLGKPLQNGYETLTRKYAWMWDQMFKSTLYRARNFKNASQIFNPISTKAFLSYLKAVAPQKVFSSYFLAGAAIDTLRQKGLVSQRDFTYMNFQTDNIAANYFTILAKRADMTALPAKDFQEAWIKAGVPAEKTATTGMAVKPIFYQRFTEADRQNVRNAIGFENTVPMITIVGGAAGVGDYALMAKSLVAAANGPVNIVAVCSNSVENYENLTALKKTLPSNVKLIIEKALTGPNFPKLVNYLKASDGVIGKSGGLSSAEFSVIGATSEVESGGPLAILLDIMGGPERANSDFAQKKGLALVTADEAQVGEMMFKALPDQLLRKRFKNNQLALVSTFTMQPVKDFLYWKPVDCNSASGLGF